MNCSACIARNHCCSYNQPLLLSGGEDGQKNGYGGHKGPAGTAGTAGFLLPYSTWECGIIWP